MASMTPDDRQWRRRVKRLEHELGRVRETVENQFARIEVLERVATNTPAAMSDAVPTLAPPPQDGPVVTVLKVDPGRPLFYAPDAGLPGLRGSPGLSCYALKDKVDLVLAIAVFDLPIQRLHDVVEMVADNQRRTRGFIPLFLTNNPDFSPFRAHRYLYEYFNAAPGFTDGQTDERRRTYQRERFQFLLRKWRVRMVIDLSETRS